MKIHEKKARALLQKMGDEGAARCNLAMLKKKVARMHRNDDLEEPEEPEFYKLYDGLRQFLEDGGVPVVVPDEREPPAGGDGGGPAPEAACEAPEEGKPQGHGDLPHHKKNGAARKVVKEKKAPDKGEGKKPPRKKAAPSGTQLDAAFEVLSAAKGPMNWREIDDEIRRRKLWAPGPGVTTPTALTLKGHLYSDVKNNPKSRFVKCDPGNFSVRKESS